MNDFHDCIVLFDGVCNLCNGTVNLLLDLDTSRKLKFASLQSEYAKKLVQSTGAEKLAADTDSILFWKDGEFFSKSDAVLKIAGLLGWPWKLLRIGYLFPRILRDLAYDFVARNRYRWFGKSETCRVPTPELKGRILE